MHVSMYKCKQQFVFQELAGGSVCSEIYTLNPLARYRVKY